MSAIVLVSGKLFDAPKRKISKADKPYAVANVRCGLGKDSVFWTVMAFGDDEVSELMMLDAGDAVSVSGGMKAEIYNPTNGKPSRVSLTVFADRVITHRQTKRAPGKKPPPAGGPKEEKRDPIPFDDSIPW